MDGGAGGDGAGPPKVRVVGARGVQGLDAATAKTMAAKSAELPCVQEDAFWRFVVHGGSAATSQEQTLTHPEAEWRLEIPHRVLETALEDAVAKDTVRFAQTKSANGCIWARIAGWSVVDNAEACSNVWHALRQHYYRPTVDETGEPAGHYLYTSHRIDIRIVTYLGELSEAESSFMGDQPAAWLVLSALIAPSPAARLALARAAVLEAQTRGRRVLAQCSGTGDMLNTLRAAGFVVRSEHVHEHAPFATYWLVAG